MRIRRALVREHGEIAAAELLLHGQGGGGSHALEKLMTKKSKS